MQLGALLVLVLGQGALQQAATATHELAARQQAAVSAQPGAGARPQQVQFDPSRFDSVTAGTLRSIIDGAAEIGLPTAPLINRAYQGLATRANGPKIIAVVRAHAAALSDAREALGATSSVQELEAGASALRAGADERTLAMVRSSRPAGAVLMPLVALTDIVIRGVPLTNAREAVTTISRLPSSDETLKGLMQTVAKNSVRGPGMALDALNRYVKNTAPGTGPPSTPVTPERKPIRPPTP